MTARVAAKCAAETRLQPAIEIMAKLSELMKTPVILAGGAVRDAMLERPIKDYDFFVRHTDAKIPTAAFMAAAGLTDCWQLSGFEPGYAGQESLMGREVAFVSNWTDIESGIPAQLISLKGEGDLNVDEAVARFDFGLCQCAISVSKQDDVYRAQFHFTPLFWSDVADRKMTYTRTDDIDGKQLARSMKRFERLSEKYPGFRFAQAAR